MIDMRITVFSVILLVFLSCAATPPAPQIDGAAKEEREELMTRIRTSVFENNHRETRKAGLRFLEKDRDVQKTSEVRLYVGEADKELGFFAEARTVLLPLLERDVPMSVRGDALMLLSEIDSEKGRFLQAANEIFEAISCGLEHSKYMDARKNLTEIVGFLSFAQLDRLRQDYASIAGVDIVLEGCLSYALATGDTTGVRKIRLQLVAADSLKAIPDHVISVRVIPPFEQRGGDAFSGKISRSIGLLCPLSGRFAQLGEAFLKGASLAVKEAGMKGVSGVELVVGDTRANALDAHRLAERMIREEGVSALVGGVLSSPTIAAAQTAQFMDVVLFSPVASEPGIDQIGDHIFQAQTSSESEIIAIARIACAVMGLKRVAFLSADDHRSRMTETLFREAVELSGGLLVVSDFYNQGNTDFRDNIERIRKADPEALLIVSEVEDLVLILPQFSFYEFGVQLLGTSVWNSGKLLRMTGRDMAGAVFPGVTDLRDHEEMYRAAVVFTDEQVTEVNRFVIGGYTGVRKMLEVMVERNLSGSGLRDEMARSLENRQHQYIELISGKGIPFFTVKDEKVVEYTTLTARP